MGEEESTRAWERGYDVISYDLAFFAVYKNENENSTSNKVITLLETRLDETGVDEMSIRRNRIRQTGLNSYFRGSSLVRENRNLHLAKIFRYTMVCQ